MKKLLMLAALSGGFAGVANAATVVVQANTTQSIAAQDGYHYYDDWLRSYEDASGFIVNGFMKFDLSALPENAVISSISLTAFLRSDYGSPANSPSSAIYKVNDDSWTQYYGNPALGAQVSSAVTAFPTANGSPVTWTLNAATLGYAADLADNTLSLAMHSVANHYSYVYFYGNQSGAGVTPYVTISYDVGTPAVPEPATWGMMILGFGAIGSALRRRTVRPSFA